MYTNLLQNQVPKTPKNPNPIGSFAEKPQVELYVGDIERYISICTPTQKKIANLFLRYRYAHNIKLTNEYVARRIKCSTKTVTRCTNKFHEDGFVTKHQDNPYAPNHYMFNDKVKRGKHAYTFWLNSLSQKHQNLYVTHGLKIDHKNKRIYPVNVPQNNKLYIDNSLYRKPRPLTRARATVGDGFFTKKEPKRRERFGQGVVIMKQFQKEWLLSHRSDPRVKDMLNNPRIKAALITPPMERITQLLSLDEREQLKLIAFPDEALEYTLAAIEPIVTGKKPLRTPVKDRVGWMLSIATTYCKNKQIKPDWQWYFQLCEIVGIDSKGALEHKPLLVEKPKPRNMGGPSPAAPKPVLTPHQQREHLLKEIEQCKIKLTEPEKHFAFCLKESVAYVTGHLERCIQDLEELETNQIIH